MSAGMRRSNMTDLNHSDGPEPIRSCNASSYIPLYPHIPSSSKQGSLRDSLSNRVHLSCHQLNDPADDMRHLFVSALLHLSPASYLLMLLTSPHLTGDGFAGVRPLTITQFSGLQPRGKESTLKVVYFCFYESHKTTVGSQYLKFPFRVTPWIHACVGKVMTSMDDHYLTNCPQLTLFQMNVLYLQVLNCFSSARIDVPKPELKEETHQEDTSTRRISVYFPQVSMIKQTLQFLLRPLFPWKKSKAFFKCPDSSSPFPQQDFVSVTCSYCTAPGGQCGGLMICSRAVKNAQGLNKPPTVLVHSPY